MRHPRCVGTIANSLLYQYVRSNTTIFASIITGGIQLRVSTLYVGHLQVVIRLSDQLYRNVWSVLGEFWGEGGSRSHYSSGYRGPGFIGLIAISSYVVPLFFKVGTTLMLGIQYKYPL